MEFLSEWQDELGNELLNPPPLDRLDDWFPFILSRSQVQQLIHSPSLPARAQIALQALYATGMRPQELTQLAPDQFRDGWIVQQRPIAIQPQIQQNLAVILEQTINQSELDQWILQADLAELFTASQRQLTPQSLRNAFATHMLENGTDLFVLHHLLGHSNLSTTLQYIPIAVASRSPSYFQHHPLTAPKNQDTPRPTPAEVLHIIQSANTPRDRTLLRSYYATGLRRNELINLRYSDLNGDENRLFVRQGKDGKDRYALIDPQTLQQIAQLAPNHKPNDLVFDLQESRVNEIFRQALQKSGLDIDLTLHSLRRAYATHCYANGMSLETLKLLLGHAQLETTTLYVDCTPEQLRKSYSLAQAVLQ